MELPLHRYPQSLPHRSDQPEDRPINLNNNKLFHISLPRCSCLQSPRCQGGCPLGAPGSYRCSKSPCSRKKSLSDNRYHIIWLFHTHVDGASIQTPFLPVVFVQVFLVQPWTMTAPSLPFGLLHFAAPSMFGASRRRNKLSGRTLILSEAMLITFTLNVAPLQACSWKYVCKMTRQDTLYALMMQFAWFLITQS